MEIQNRKLMVQPKQPHAHTFKRASSHTYISIGANQENMYATHTHTHSYAFVT